MLIPRVPLGRTGLTVSRIGYGAFKIGRNQGIKYPSGYELPPEQEVARLLNEILDLGINYIDTAPAYGLSEERIGNTIAHRREEFVLSTKVGETYTDGVSHYDFSRRAIRQSLESSFRKLKTEMVDLVWIHSNGDDLWIQNETPVVEVLREYKERGLVRAIGLSGKTIGGARIALEWADALMVEYHRNDRSHEEIMKRAASLRKAVIVKKGLAAGHLPVETAIPFVLQNPTVTSLVIGGLNLQHLRENLSLASEKPQPPKPMALQSEQASSPLVSSEIP